MATARRKFEQPFNRQIPPLFVKGGYLYTHGDIGAKLALMVEMPEDRYSLRDWTALYRSAVRGLADLCFLFRRAPSFAELSQLDWLAEAGHKLWWADDAPPRSNINLYIEQLEKRLKEKK